MKQYLIYFVLPLLLFSCKETQPEETPIDFSFYQSCLEEGGHKLDILAQALADKKISLDDDFNWSYDFRKEGHDRYEMYDKFEQRVFELADQDEVFFKKISEYYAQWPEEIIEDLANRPQAGAKKIARRVQVIQSAQPKSE